MGTCLRQDVPAVGDELGQSFCDFECRKQLLTRRCVISSACIDQRREVIDLPSTRLSGSLDLIRGRDSGEARLADSARTENGHLRAEDFGVFLGTKQLRYLLKQHEDHVATEVVNPSAGQFARRQVGEPLRVVGEQRRQVTQREMGPEHKRSEGAKVGGSFDPRLNAREHRSIDASDCAPPFEFVQRVEELLLLRVTFRERSDERLEAYYQLVWFLRHLHSLTRC